MRSLAILAALDTGDIFISKNKYEAQDTNSDQEGPSRGVTRKATSSEHLRESSTITIVLFYQRSLHSVDQIC